MLSGEEIFIRIVEAVEAAGGELVPETHTPQPVFYEVTGRHGRRRQQEEHTVACNAEALVDLPYVVPAKGDEPLAEVGKARLCVICDRLDLWPRFAEASAE